MPRRQVIRTRSRTRTGDAREAIEQPRKVPSFRLKRLGRCVAVAVLMFAVSPLSWAQAWPSKPIRLIIPAAAGGSTDVTGRSMATRLSEILGQPIVVDNRTGAGGLIGLEAAAKAAPDGYTLLHSADSGIVVSPHLYKMPFDVARDLLPIAPTARASLFFIVRPDLPVKTLGDFIAYARANPGKLNYGSAGHGTLQHIATEMMMQIGKFRVTHVPYKGSQQVLVDLLAGQVDCTFDLGAAIPHIRSGKVRLLAVPEAARSTLFPDVPTMSEAGAEVVITWTSGVYAPTGIPRDIVTRLNREIGRVMQAPETRARLTAMAAEVMPPMTPEQFAEHQQRARDRFGAVVRSANIKLQ
jgi:tripartite-type tricarboxylate transporter receptor subunit TctC